MPTLLRADGLRIYFYADEGTPLEPAHVHVTNGPDLAKFWLVPEVRLASFDGFDARKLRRIEKIVVKNRVIFEEEWNEFFRRAGRL